MERAALCADRYGKPQAWVDDFVRQYGYDLAEWDGYAVMMGMRDLVQLSGAQGNDLMAVDLRSCEWLRK